ncbi:MAG TPA: glycosyltransferase, partial [Candidatus Limnocylindrales bacterium]|nr:glycosyltransferase [Candidatus Limnocylindrales bacterium]
MDQPRFGVARDAVVTGGRPSSLEHAAAPRHDPRPGAGGRPRVAGRFLSVGDDKLYVRGVTYGTFLPAVAGDDGYDPTQVDEDFARMVAAGINAVRVYEVPPAWLLDAAERHGLWVSIDVPWEEHVAFLDRAEIARPIVQRTEERVRHVAGHPAILAFAVGNEIPSRIVRWHGAERVAEFVERLVSATRKADPDALVTYVNYPSTEYLRIRGVDFDAWNVYLERPADFERYAARLQNLSADRPVVISELGADSRRLGEAAQAGLVAAEVRAAFAAGSAGTFVFAWTDEWARGGTPVTDWDFGMTTRDRLPKPSLAALEAAYRDVPFPADTPWPSISVVLCSYNGARVIDRCLRGLAEQDYPDYDVIVVDDGSTDETATIASGYDVTLVRTPNQGLSAARNEGLARARAEIVAYIDDDAWPDRDWLRYLAWTFVTTDHAGVGGPNLPPPDDGRVAGLVALAPGGPLHVLRTDTEAEHIPGCNSSFRTEHLRAIGGYDPRFRTAGDDVDVCWRLHEQGWSVGFSPGAMVWHHRRPTIRGYLRQQRGYGFAEALLERKWPGRFNALGHVTWPGNLYGSGAGASPLASNSIYAGTWGTAPYQSIYERSSSWAAAPLMPEWWSAIVGLAALGLLRVSWAPLWLLWALAIAMAVASVLVAVAIAMDRLSETGRPMTSGDVITLTWLVLGQSLARLRGRIAGGLTPWRRRGIAGRIAPTVRTREVWSEDWQAMESRLRALEGQLVAAGVATQRGGGTERWDLEARTGSFGSVRVLGTVEEHGHGRQMVRWRMWPHVPAIMVAAALALLVLSARALLDDAVLAAFVLAALFAAVSGRIVMDTGTSMAVIDRAVAEPSRP